MEAKDEKNNPFTPIFGKVPAVLAGRTAIIDSLVDALDSGNSSPELCSVITGVRGSGKTTLLQYIQFRAEELGWIVASTTAQNGMLDDIVQRAFSAAEHLSSTSSATGLKLTGVQLAHIGLTWDHDETPKQNFRSKITDLLEGLETTSTGIVFIVDEVTGDLAEMVELAAVFQHFIRENRKVALFMAGLPYNVSTLLSGKTTSFLRRAAQFNLGAVPDYEVKEAFELTVKEGGKSINEDALDLATKEIAGFPFMMQLVGYRSWKASDQNAKIELQHVRQGSCIAKEELKTRIFGATISELSKGDVEFLSAMNKDGEVTSRLQIEQKTGRSSSWISKYKKRLLVSGLIEETILGDLKFSLPGLAEYLSEVGI